MGKKKAVLISCFNWYKERLEPVREYLLEKGFEVLVLIADFDHIKKQLTSPKYSECTYVHVPEYNKNLSVKRIYSHLIFGKEANEIVKEYEPDLIYLQVPPNNIAKYCASYRKQHNNSKLVLDIIDLWPESMPLGKLKGIVPVSRWKKWRNDAITVGDHIFTECELYQKWLSIPKEKTSTLYLFKEQTYEEKTLCEQLIFAKDVSDSSDTIKFAYLGSMNNIIDIIGICEVLKSCIKNDYKVELHAIGDGEGRVRFQEAIENINCKAFFYGPIYEETKKISILVPCDYALNMMQGDLAVGLTIKSIDYLSYGLPLINNIKGDTWELVEKEKIGINVSGEEEVKLPSKFDRKEIIEIYKKRFSKEAFINQIHTYM